MHPNFKYQINLRVLKRLNNNITSISNTASHAVLYEFDVENSIWTKINIEGPIFTYRKCLLSYTGLFILNRLDLKNFEMELMNCVVTYKDPYIMLQNEDKIYGIWIHDAVERETMFGFIKKAITQAQVPPSPEMDIPPGFEDMSENSNALMDMLVKAKSKTVKPMITMDSLVNNKVSDYMANNYKPLDRLTFEVEVLKLVKVVHIYIECHVH